MVDAAAVLLKVYTNAAFCFQKYLNILDKRVFE